MGIAWWSNGWDSCAFASKGVGPIPVQGAKILQAVWWGQKKKKKLKHPQNVVIWKSPDLTKSLKLPFYLGSIKYVKGTVLSSPSLNCVSLPTKLGQLPVYLESWHLCYILICFDSNGRS